MTFFWHLNLHDYYCIELVPVTLFYRTVGGLSGQFFIYMCHVLFHVLFYIL